MLQFKEIKVRFLSHCHYHVFIKASTASLCNRRSEIRKRQTWKWRKKCWLLKLWKFDLVAIENKHRSLCLCIYVLKTTDQHSLTWHGWNVIVSFLKTKKIQKEPRMDSKRPYKQTKCFLVPLVASVGILETLSTLAQKLPGLRILARYFRGNKGRINWTTCFDNIADWVCTLRLSACFFFHFIYVFRSGQLLKS